MSSSHPRVKIVNTQPRSVEGYSSCLEYWRKTTGGQRKRCCVIGCSRDIHDCAVVQIKGGNSGNEWYYIPFCSYHLGSPDEMEIESIAPLVSARKDKDPKVVKAPAGQPAQQQETSAAQDAGGCIIL